VCSSAAGHHPGYLAAYHSVISGTADALFWFAAEWIDAARALQTDPTAKAGFAITALWLHLFVTVEHSFHVLFFCFFKHF
jgi:hypothetical protein